MFEKRESAVGEDRETGTRWRRSETSPWSRSRRRAAAYATSVHYLQGVMAMRSR